MTNTARAVSEKLFDKSIYKIKSVKIDSKKECLIMLGETTVKYTYIDLVETDPGNKKAVFKKCDEFFFPCIPTTNASYNNIQRVDVGKVLIQNSGCIFIFNTITEKIELVADFTSRKNKHQILHSLVDGKKILFVEYLPEEKISIINKIDIAENYKVVSRVKIGKKVIFIHKHDSSDQYLLVFYNSVGVLTLN